MHYEQLDGHSYKSPGRGVRHRGNITKAADAHEKLEGKCNVQSVMQRRGKGRKEVLMIFWKKEGYKGENV